MQGASEAQLSAWVQHIFQQYLGYTHWKEITREGSSPVGSKGSKQLFPDLRINVLETGVIFVECKRLGRLDGPKGQVELEEAKNQLMSYIRAFVDQAATKPKTVLGVVTDGNRWLLLGVNKANQFHKIEEWAFLTDDPRLIAQRLWLLAKPALAQPTSALVEFMARRTLAEVLKDYTKLLTKKVNEKLPDGTVSQESIGKWLREALSDPMVPFRLIPSEPAAVADTTPKPSSAVSGPLSVEASPGEPTDKTGASAMKKRFWEALLSRPNVKDTRHAKLAASESGWISAGSGVKGVPFTYTIGQEKGRVELWIDRGAGRAAENKEIFDGLHKHKVEIEKAFGGVLSWQRLDEKQGSRIAFATDAGGYGSAESEWPAIEDAMIDAMAQAGESANAPPCETKDGVGGGRFMRRHDSVACDPNLN